MLSREQSFAIVKYVLCREESFMACEEANVTQSASLIEDLAFDSLDHVELAMELEEMLGIDQISSEDMEECANVGDVVTMLLGKKVNTALVKSTLEKVEKASHEREEALKRAEKETAKARAAKAGA